VRLSATGRMTALIALAVLAVSALGFALQYALIERALQARQARLVAADLDGFAALYDQRRIIAVRQAIEFRLLQDGAGDLLLALQDRNGRLLAGNADPWPAALPAPPAGPATPPTTFTHAGRPYLGVARTLPGGFPMLAARGTDAVGATLAELRRIGMMALAGALGVGLGAGYWASRRVMARIDRVNGLADRVAGGEVSARLPGARSADEFGRLEAHIHAMLDRIEGLNRAAQHLSDTVAHELRTPLTRIQTQLSRLDPAAPDTGPVLAEIRATIRIFDSLLEIARAEAETGTPPGWRPLDLSALAEEVFELYAPAAEDGGLKARARIDPGAAIFGDRNLVAQLLSNLLDNAIKFSPPGAEVTLSLERGAARHRLTISDTGPGLPPGLADTVFDRFARAARDREVPGHGLGLALVQAIALRHGAKPTLVPVEKGFSLEIEWPTVGGAL